MGENWGYPDEQPISEREFNALKDSERRYANELAWANQGLQDYDNTLVAAFEFLPTNKAEEFRKRLAKLRKKYDL